jgi:RNase P subunit RPR2
LYKWEFFNISAPLLIILKMMYKEKRSLSKLAERTCVCCGNKWLVRDKNSQGKAIHLLCPDCISKLTMSERQYYYKINSGLYHSETRKCLNCGKEWKIAVENSITTDKKALFCSECNKVLSNSQKKSIRSEKDESYRNKVKEQKHQSNIRNIRHLLWKRAKDRAIQKGYDFTIEESDIIIPNKCPLLEIPLEYGRRGKYENAPSLDRIDNTKGYIKGNVWVISKKANSMKNSATFEELNTFCTNILRYSLTNREKEPVESEDKKPQR